VVTAIALLGACPRMITDSGYVLSVAPAAANLFVQDSAHFSATLVDKSGAPVSAPVTWSIDNPSVASIDANGMARAIGPGTTTVRASAKGVEAHAALAVVVDSGQTLTVSPPSANLFVNGSQQLTATLKDRHGNPISAGMEWESSNSAVATVDATGLVHAQATGTATIQAKARGLVAAASITVAPQPASVVLVGAGDIASCSGVTNSGEATAKLLDGISGTVFTAGDNAYNNGSAPEYASCYGPSWGRHKSRTHPAIGNHEYNTTAASGYFGYFGSAAGAGGKAYYSYDLGAWHVIVLDSNLDMSASSPQLTWLRADLAAHPVRCTLRSGITRGSAPAITAARPPCSRCGKHCMMRTPTSSSPVMITHMSVSSRRRPPGRSTCHAGSGSLWWAPAAQACTLSSTRHRTVK